MNKPSITLQRIILALIAIILLATVFFIWQHNKSTHTLKLITLQNGTMLTPPLKLQPFDLMDIQGHAFTNSRLKGHWSLLFFGFTNCPSICPTTLAKLNKIVLILQANHTKPLPQVVFISVDPERDGPTKIHQYLTNFNKHFIGATGNKEELTKLTKQLGILYKAENPADSNNFISHSGTIILISPSGAWTALFNPPLNSEAIAKDFVRIQNHFKRSSQ